MIYLDNGATSFPKPPAVIRAVSRALSCCANPGRGGYEAAMAASKLLYRCRERAGELFSCPAEQVVFTPGCTQGLNIAIRALVKPGTEVAISGFEHNAVTRPLHALGAKLHICGRKLFCWENVLEDLENALKQGVKVAVFTHASNVFGYILPISEIAHLCRRYGAKLIVDAAQSAGMLEVNLEKWGASFVAMPGHKGLLGPQGTGLLLCGEHPQPLVFGGTGSLSESQSMPDFLPDCLEAGTVNVPGIAGLLAGLEEVRDRGCHNIFRREQALAKICAEAMEQMGLEVFSGPHQGGTVSFCPKMDCEEAAQRLAQRGIGVRAGLHCAPLAHESAGTLRTGTVRVGFGHSNHHHDLSTLLTALEREFCRRS